MIDVVNALFRQAIVGAFGLQFGVLAYLISRAVQDEHAARIRQRPPLYISVLIGVSWLALTISALSGTLIQWNRDLEGWDVTFTLTLRLIGLGAGLPSLFYVWRLPPAVQVVAEEESENDEG